MAAAEYLAAGVLTATRRDIEYSVPALLWDAGQIMWGWLADLDQPLASASLALLALAAAAALLLLGVDYIRAQWQKPTWADWRPAAICGGFALANFVLVMAAIVRGNSWFGVEPRYLTPLYIPILAAARQYGFESRHFTFWQHGVLLDGKCLVLVPIPDYPIAGIRTGQYILGAGELWLAELYPAAAERYSRIAAALAAAGKPLISSAYDIYRSDDSLIYAKEPCTAADAEVEFFRHIALSTPKSCPPKAGRTALRIGSLYSGNTAYF